MEDINLNFFKINKGDNMNEKPRNQSIVIIGLGEVGSSLYEIAIESEKFSVFGYDIDSTKSIDDLENISEPVDYLHVAIPYSSTFVSEISIYIEKLKPSVVFIHSTIPPGTTRKVYNTVSIPIVYTPVRGKYPNIKRHLLFWSKWITSIPLKGLSLWAKHLMDLGFKVIEYKGPPETLELAKLWETVYRAIMISAWQEFHRIVMKYKADIIKIAEFIGEVHQILWDRPIYFPGYISGHCLISNTKILNSIYPSKLFDFVLESNNKRAKEILKEDIRNDIKKMERLAMKHTNLDYYKVI